MKKQIARCKFGNGTPSMTRPTWAIIDGGRLVSKVLGTPLHLAVYQRMAKDNKTRSLATRKSWVGDVPSARTDGQTDREQPGSQSARQRARNEVSARVVVLLP